MEELRKLIITIYGFLIFAFTILGIVGYFTIYSELSYGGFSLYSLLPVIIGVPLLIGTIVILIDNNALLRDIRNLLKEKEKEN